jgi:hypothetical protein
MRRSTSAPFITTRARPSCGMRRSVMFRPAMIFRRERMPFAMLMGGAGIVFSKPSILSRT